jgi:hypothetical protein
LRDRGNVAEIGLFGSIRTAAPAMGIDTSPPTLREAGEIERGVAAFAREPNGGLIAGKRGVDRSSRADHRAGGPAPAPCGLPGSPDTVLARADEVIE